MCVEVPIVGLNLSACPETTAERAASSLTWDRRKDAVNPALLTDLYELTMAASYFEHKMFAPATFSLFIRSYPAHRGYFVNAGLEDVLSLLESFHLEQDDLDYLKSTKLFKDDFLHFLAASRFTGEVHAMPEGSLFFINEPIIEVTAPIIEAQLVETLVINIINLQVMVATKAARCLYAAHGRRLVDFALRRTQGTDAGLKVARASYIAGFTGTSNVLAGKLYDIPISGTMAHSFVTSFRDETAAFRAYIDTFPDNTVLLIDTYDTLHGARKAVEVGKELERKGKRLKGVRLDSGDLVSLSKEVRRILNEGGFSDVPILVSGALDEVAIANAVEQGAPIDVFGVGTKMGVSADAPYTDMAYKLVRYARRPVLKLSARKQTLVCDKQVFRAKENGRLAYDTIALRAETCQGEPLLQPSMSQGRRLQPSETLDTIAERFREEFVKLDDSYKALQNPKAFPVYLGPELEQLQSKMLRRVREEELGES